MKYIIGLIRTLIASSVMIFYLIRLFVRIAMGGNVAQVGYEESSYWGATTTKALGVKVDVKGQIPAGRGLILANHRSFCDIFALIGMTNCCFVAMKEVESWALIGFAAKAVGTIFVDRKDQQSRRATSIAIKKRLTQGFCVTVFPEGIACQGPDIEPFKHGTFKIAAEGNIPIIPVAIEYEKLEQGWGEEGFTSYFFRVFGSLSAIKVKIRIGETITGDHFEPLLTHTETWIAKNLTEMRAEWGR
ncbi:MAG: lysophospholipid acyltransferase family protein [Bacteroidia bacterium]